MPAHEELLLDLIRDAFGDVALGDGISLHEARAIDNYCTLEKRREARAKDTEESWQQIPDAVIEEHYDIFPFLDAKGFRYLLPAYMCWTVRYLKKSQSNTSEFIVYALMPRCWLAEEGERMFFLSNSLTNSGEPWHSFSSGRKKKTNLSTQKTRGKP
jgi:hypothetical protein